MDNTRKKVAIIIDHSNLRHTYLESKELRNKGRLDYSQLVKKLTNLDDLVGKVVFLNRELAGKPLCYFF